MGTRTMEHRETLLPVIDMTLDDETRDVCDKLVPPASALANFHYAAGWMKMKLI